MHVLCLVETAPERHEQYQKFLNSLEYGEEKDHPFAREVRLYDITIQKKYSKNLLEELYTNRYDSARSNYGKVSRFKNMLLKLLKVDPVDDSKLDLKRRSFKDGWVYTHVIGTLPDSICPKTGRCMV